MEKNIEVRNLHLYCCTCLCTFTGLKYVINETAPPSLFELFKRCTGLRNSKNALYPRYICELCFDCLEKFDEFQTTARESMQYLQELLKLYKPAEEVDVESEKNNTFNESEVLETNLSDYEDNEESLSQCGGLKTKDGKDSENCSVEFRLMVAEDTVNLDENKLQESTDVLVNVASIEQINPHKAYKSIKRASALKALTRINQKGQSNFACDLCESNFNSMTRLTNHINRTHAENPVRIVCMFGCEKTFKNKDTERSHYRRQHSDKTENYSSNQYICEDCGRAFKCFAALREHSYRHRPVEDRPFRCELCNKRYVLKKTYKEHMLRHAGIKNFECADCGLKKTTKKELRNHMKYHTNELKVSCAICSKIFGSLANLRRHIKLVHEGIKNFKCRFCEECFGKAETLKNHEMRHTGEKPHKCETCGRKFIQQVALKKHMRTHNKHS